MTGEGKRGDGELPEGWRWATVGELANVGTGATPKRGDPRYWDEGDVPWVTSSALNEQVVTGASEFTTRAALKETNLTLYPPGTLLVAMYGEGKTRGMCAELGIEAATNQAIAAIRLHSRYEPWRRFLKQFFAYNYEKTREIASGGVQPNLNLSAIRGITIPVPPLPEQRRIVAKLDSLQARSRRARGAREAVPPLLEKLRQSILAAAFRGDLTADWREQHPDVEPASELLKRIRIERRKKWEQAELAKLKAKGKTPTDDKWKQKYVEPEPVDDSELPELPEGWVWASVEEVCPLDAPAVYGIIQPGDDVPDGVPYIRPVDITPQGTVDLASIKRTTPQIAANYSRASLRTGDLVLSIVGTIGKVIITPKELDRANITQSSIRIRPPGFLTSEYLRLVLQSPLLTKQFDRYRFGNAVQRLNVEHVRCLAIPIAPSEEMKVIERTVVVALARLPVRGTATTTKELARLDSAILSKAFRGELVPQDSNDVTATPVDAKTTSVVPAPTQTKGTGVRRTRRNQ